MPKLVAIPGRALRAVAGCLFLAVMLALLLGLGAGRGLNHDEHQFVASGKLVAEGMPPYRDFPYFHTPLLSLLNGLLFRFTPALLLSARLVSILSAWLGLIVLFLFTQQRLALQSPTRRMIGGVGVVLLLASAPIFIHTSGRAWNHDLPVLLALLAFLLQRRALALGDGGGPQGAVRSRHAIWFYAVLLFGSGLLVGLAASTRLSFAVLAPVFLLSIWLAPTIQPASSAVRQRGLGMLAFTAGGLLGGGPLFWSLWQAPEAFWFGNVEYIQLNTRYYRMAIQDRGTMTLPGKLLYCARLFVTQPGNLLLVVAGGWWLVAGGWWLVAACHQRLASAVWLLYGGALLCTLLAALGATPSQPQYFYALLPWLALCAGEGLATLPPARQRQGVYLLASLGGLAALLAAPSYWPAVRTLWDPTGAYAWKIHSQAQALATLVDQGKVLTLAPIYALEGEVAIEPALATGPFAWRVADLVEEERRIRLGLLGPAALSARWAAHPPRAVLATAEADDAVEQRPLVDAAVAHGYTPVETWDDNTLWLSPLVEWGSSNAPAIRLGGHTLPRTHIAPGETFAATFYLQNVASISGNLNVLVRLVGEDGREAARSEGWPWGSATSTWTTGAVWPDGHTFSLPHSLAAGYYRVEMSFYEPETLATLGDVATVDFVRVGVLPEAGPTTPVASLGGQFALVQAAIAVGNQPQVAVRAAETAPARAGDVLALDLIWQAQTGRPLGPAANYTVFVHLVGPDGLLLAQRDQPPLNGFFPTSFWRPSDIVTDRVELVLPSAAPPGVYQLWVGMYDPASLQRLPLVQAGAPAGDAVQVGTVQVLD
jgi:hypothetical protein